MLSSPAAMLAHMGGSTPDKAAFFAPPLALAERALAAIIRRIGFSKR